MDFYILLGGLGLITGLLSGLLGIGGGIVMAPLLLYAPQWFGFPALVMRDVAGLTIVQGLVGCLAGALSHRKLHFVSSKLTAWMGGTIFLAALGGGAAAGVVANTFLLALFATMAFSAAVLIFIPTKTDCEQPLLATFSFSRFKAVLTAGTVGLLGGLVGQGGSFLLIPLMTSFMQVPTRIAIGSNLAIVSLSSLAAFIGKACTGQIVWHLSLPIIAAAAPAALAGSSLSSKVPVAKLRLLLAVCIALTAIKIGFSALGFF